MGYLGVCGHNRRQSKRLGSAQGDRENEALLFTGLIESVGEIAEITRHGDGARLTISAPEILGDAQRGDSIAVNGVCLTVLEFDDARFSADVMQQTLSVTSFDRITAGQRVNLERAARIDTRLGGHIVQGHIDGVGRVLQVRPGAQWRVLRISLPRELAPLVVDKGSITVEGVSLTVSAVSAAAGECAGQACDANSVTDAANAADTTNAADAAQHWFEVSLIPETLAETTLGALQEGNIVNLETDILARHVRRISEFARLQGGQTDCESAAHGEICANEKERANTHSGEAK